MQKITQSFFKRNFPRRSKNSYKNLNGRVLIVAGSADMPGAAVLCARACFRTGTGLVTLAVPSTLYNAAVNAVPEALILRLPDENYLTKASLKFIANHNKNMPHDLLLAGPGLGKGAQIILKLLALTKLPAVLDADALNFIAGRSAEKLRGGIPYILTPHAGEIKRLLKNNKLSENAVCELSALTGAVSILKGPHTQVCYQKNLMQNTTGNEGLAKAGSGDILAGIIAGIWAQIIRSEVASLAMTNHRKAFLAVALGVYLHGAAADDAVKKISKTSLMASDVCDQLPFTLKQIIG